MIRGYFSESIFLIICLLIDNIKFKYKKVLRNLLNTIKYDIFEINSK